MKHIFLKHRAQGASTAFAMNEAQWRFFTERTRQQFSSKWAPPPIITSYRMAKMLWGAR